MTLAPTVSPATPQSPSQSEALVSAVLASKGNLALASERLGLSLTDVAKLLNDPDTTAQLSQAIRGQVLLSAYNAFDEISVILPAHIASLEPNEVYRAFSSLLSAVALLSAPTKVAPSTLIQNNNYFTPEDAEAARGKLLRFVSRVGDSDAIEGTFVEPSVSEENRANSVA